MKAIIQNLRTGTPNLEVSPCPALPPQGVLIRSRASLISAGTERMLVEFGKGSWIAKARHHPDKVRLALAKARTDGLAATVRSIRSKLDAPIPLGYSNAGVVIETAPSVDSTAAGMRVVSNGGHAELVCVPKTLCARIPDSVPDDSAAFTVVSAIGLQGIRLARPEIGEHFVVIGLGLIGLITVQLLRAQGCSVLGLDFDSHRLRLAEQFGAETVDLSAGADPVLAAERFSGGRGVDAALITAATNSNSPVHQAALMCRKRGRIVLVGVAGLQLSRDDFYKKELSFQVSCSYGPGRYDPVYEAGQDYPLPHVRWTAQRNFETVLRMMEDRRLNVEALITHRIPFDQAQRAYDLIQSSEPHLGVILQYPRDREAPTATLLDRSVPLRSGSAPSAAGRVGLIGAGGYSDNVLIPALRKAGASLEVIVSNGGISAAVAGRKFGFRSASTDAGSVFSNPGVDTVVIATRHDSHADYVCRALRAGKNVYVEKPLALTRLQIDAIERAYADASAAGAGPRLMIGFNRRFSPLTVQMKVLLAGTREPKSMILTVNAGRLESGHWTLDSAVGGGRMIGEGCHFIDLLRFLADSPIKAFHTSRSAESASADSFSFTLTFEDGSIGTVHYFGNGDRSFPKERVEVFCGGRILQLDNFRRLRGFGYPKFKRMNLWCQRKGAEEAAAAFVSALRERRPSPIPFPDILEVSRAAIDIAGAL